MSLASEQVEDELAAVFEASPPVDGEQRHVIALLGL